MLILDRELLAGATVSRPQHNPSTVAQIMGKDFSHHLGAFVDDVIVLGSGRSRVKAHAAINEADPGDVTMIGSSGAPEAVAMKSVDLQKRA
jgi:hypothetical protein